MKIETFVTGIVSTNCYLAINETSKQTVVIDPAACPKKLLDFINDEKLVIEGIFLTHAHFDHILGLKDFLCIYPVPVYINEKGGDILKDPHQNLSMVYTDGFSFEGADYLKDGDVIEIAGFNFKAIWTPGHTPDGTCYYEENEKVLFSGDTLFEESVGRTDFANSDTKALEDSIKEKLFILPNDVKVFPGHMGATTIGHEKEYNPYV
ncbi:MAG: MBL fold metallo-hydrolase [Lachnospiraceae bacterium]|jgi:glyoxylase-like metal-dependent hydrolase (beta-lactamase superfamily II)|nr:MBL fold metallo-hydrolase [Lachnospiraceae bacterium]